MERKLKLENGIKIDKANWTLTTLGDIAIDVNVRVANPSQSAYERFVGLEHIISGELKISSWSGTDALTSAAKSFIAEDVLFARRNVYLKRASLVGFEGVCSGDAFVLRCKPDVITPSFLSFILNSERLWKFAISNAAGTMSKRVKWRDLEKFEFLLPPIKEQNFISELIWSSDTTVDKAKQLKSCLEIQRQSIFKERCNSTKGEIIPVKDVLKDGPKNGFSPKGNSLEQGYQTVSIGAVSNGLFVAEGNIKYAIVDDDVLEKFDVKADDVFVVRGNGNKQLCGKAGISLRNYDHLFYPDLLIRLRFDDEIILPCFAAFQWNTQKVHEKLLRSAKSTNGIWKINGDDVKRHKIYVPSLAVQKEVMKEMSVVDRNINLCEDFILSSIKLRSGLINEII
jgi:type I restriction enzyme S subunit